MREYVTKFIKPYITAEDIYYLSVNVSTGDEIQVEVYKPNTNGGEFIVETAIVLRKYSHMVLTDKGASSWNEIAMLNRHLLGE